MVKKKKVTKKKATPKPNTGDRLGKFSSEEGLPSEYNLSKEYYEIYNNFGSGEDSNYSDPNFPWRHRCLTFPGEFAGQSIPRNKRRIALAFQGGANVGGAFAAGAVKALVDNKVYDNLNVFDSHKVDTFSGTSSGALVASALWACIVNERFGIADGLKLNSLPSHLEKQWMHFANRTIPTTRVARGLMGMENLMRQNPIYDHLAQVARVPLIRSQFIKWIKRGLVDVDLLQTAVEEQIRKGSENIPGLVMGATEIRSGELTSFREDQFSLDAVLASGSIDEVNGTTEVDYYPRGRRIGQAKFGVFLDGAWSQNPPIDELTEYGIDEIWLFRVFPSNIKKLPTNYFERADRRDELWQNTLVEQELNSIRRTNIWLSEKWELDKQTSSTNDTTFPLYRLNNIDQKYRKIKAYEIVIDREFAKESSLINSPKFLKRVLDNGYKKTVEHLEKHSSDEENNGLVSIV